MAHNARLNIDSFYGCAVNLPASFWQALDNAQFASVNAEAGGTWAPAAAIQLNGAGLWICSTSTIAGLVINSIGSGARFILGDNDYVGLQAGHTGQTRTLVTAVSEGADTSGGTAMLTSGNSNGMTTDAGFGSTVWRSGSRLTVPLRVHDGGTFTQVVFSFVITNAHASLPVSMPQFRVFKVDANGTVTQLKSATGITGGFVVFPTPANVAAYIAGGAVQNFTYTLDASIVIDRSSYLYFAEIVDEAGANSKAGNLFTTIASTFTLIPDLRPQ